MMRFAVIGNPVAHSLSPFLHNWVFDQLRLDAHYTKRRITKEKLPRVIDEVRSGKLNGINITLPHKESAIHHVDELSVEARHIQAVNCVVRRNGKLLGYDTDCIGFTTSLQKSGVSVADKTCVLLGAGGGAKGVLFSLVSGKAKAVYVANRHREKASKLITLMSPINKTTTLEAIPLDQIEPHLKNDVIIINCTPVGMSPNIHDSPVPKQFIRSSHILFDIVYTPLRTQFVKLGERVDAKTVKGLPMFIYQGLASLDLWFNESISNKVDVEKLTAYLERRL